MIVELKSRNFQKKSVETLRTLIITLADF